mgnify:CR=1 FL=1
MYLLKEGGKDGKARVQLLGSGTILREVEAAAEMLKQDYGVDADIWSVTSFNELRREALELDAGLHRPQGRRGAGRRLRGR